MALQSGCYIQTQRFPGALDPTVDPLGPGSSTLYEAGPEEALIVRHADTVMVRPAGGTATRMLEFHDKRTRLSSGSWIFTGPTGKVEVLLPGGARLELTGTAACVIGSESRRDPIFRLRQLSRATITCEESAQFELPGGARLACDTGPFVLEQVGERVLRLRNRSIGLGRVAYRDELFDLAPGEVVDLALPPSGTAPFARDPGFRTLTTDSAPLEIRGELEVLEEEAGARLRAVGPNEIVGYGLVLRLDEGDEVLFEGLGPREQANGTNP
ncbi:MAG: hypothetical protein R3F49_01305 [Planctomycetota bacterium]